MAIPLALAAIAATVGGGIAFSSVLPDSILNDDNGGTGGDGGGIDLNIPWLNITVVLGAFVVLKTFVETATEELL
jgi:hypothetical protein